MARSFNATSDRIDIANESNFDFERTNAFSLAVWIEPSFNASGAILMKEDGSSSALRGYGLFHRAGGSNPTFAFEAQNTSAGSNRLAIRTTSEFATGQWHHVVVTYDGSSTPGGVKIYVDGSSQALTTIESDPLSATILNNVLLQIGCRGGAANPSFFTNGPIGLCAVYNAVLTSGEVTSLYNGTAPNLVHATALVSAWALDEVAGSGTAADFNTTNAGTYNGTTQAWAPMACKVLPVISGNTQIVGAVLSCSTGTWTESNGTAGSAPTYSYQWKRDGVAIGGATSSTYTFASADSGHVVSCDVTASNASSVSKTVGSQSATQFTSTLTATQAQTVTLGKTAAKLLIA